MKKDTKENTITKDTKGKTSKNKERLLKGVNKLEENRKMIYAFVGGALLVTLITFIIWPDRIATLKDGTQPVATIDGKNFTADFLYEKMKDKYSISYLLDYIDDEILSKKYKENEDMISEVEKSADEYLSYYKQYGYTEESFLAQNGFANKEAFINYLKIDYRRKLYHEDYLKSQISDKDIQKYYDEKVQGDINTQHILVKISDKVTDEDAKKKAEEIIKKLNDGTSWEDVIKEYKDAITFEDLKYVAFNANYESAFKEALLKLENDSYSKEPVKTSYGYHIIHRFDQKEKAKLEDLKDTIIETISKEMDEADPKLYNKNMIKMREEAKLEFPDTVIGDKYKIYCDELLKTKSE